MTHQLDLFGVKDTPLFSGSPVRVKVDDYNPVKRDIEGDQMPMQEEVATVLEITNNGGRLVGEVQDNNYNPIEAANLFIKDYFEGSRELSEWAVDSITFMTWYFTVTGGVSTYRMTYNRGCPGITRSTWKIARI